MDLAEHVEAVAIGKPDVEQNHIVGCVFDTALCLRSVGSGGHAITFLAQDLLERGADFSLVIHDQDMIHERNSFMDSAGSTSGAWSAGLSMRGRRRRKRAPLGKLPSARMVPLCS